MKFFKSSFLFLFANLMTGHAATITWNGSGDGTGFNNPANWVGNAVPGASDDAVITSGAGTYVVVTSDITVLSVNCSKAFSVSSGTFVLTAGSSQINGAFALAGGNLKASGVGTTFTANGPATADDCNFYVSAGAVVALPNLVNYSKNCNGANWTVTGVGSVLNLSGLTNITGQACTFPLIQAAAGGHLLAPKLATVTAGPLAFQADGTNSLIDLSGLTNCSSLTTYTITFEASAGGTIQMPLMPGGPLVSVTLNAGGSISTAQLKQLDQLTIFTPSNFNALTNVALLAVSGATSSFPVLNNFTGGNISVLNGASVTLPALLNYTKTTGGVNWTVSGSNSVLNLSGLTNITGLDGGNLIIQAETGGAIILTNVATVHVAPLTFQADGTNSLIDLSGLTSCSSPASDTVNFEASAGGTIRMPLMPGGPLISVTLNAGGTISTAQLEQLYQLTVSGATSSFPVLNNFNDGNISVLNGASVTLPALLNYTKNCNGANWTVTGAGSVLNLSGLTNITGQACTYPVIQAAAGGHLLAPELATVTAGALTFQADGTNSLIDLSALVSASGQDPYPLTFEASAGGTIKASIFAGGPLVDMILNPGGNLPLAQLRQLFSITANNGAVANLPALTNLDGGSLSAAAGGQIILPALQVVNPLLSCDKSSLWEANGTGSQIIAPALVALGGSACVSDQIEALAGGQITLNNLNSMNGLDIKVLADGAGSVIDLSHISSFLSTKAVASSLTAQNGGVILLGTQAFLQNIAINISSGNPVLPSFTNSGPNLTFYGIAWHSYLVQQLNTAIPGASWQFFLYVPLTNSLQEISAASPANTAFRATDFVADSPLLTLAVPNLHVQLVLYGATNKTYELLNATNLPFWTSNAVAVMTNAFRIFPPAVVGSPSEFFRAMQIAP